MVVINDRMTAVDYVSKLLRHECCGYMCYMCCSTMAWPAPLWTMTSGRQCLPSWSTVHQI